MVAGYFDYEISTAASLGVIASVLGAGIVASLAVKDQDDEP